MQTKTELALERFDNGFNCAQSVFSVFCEKYGLDLEMGLRLAGGLGGGARCGSICGAASGAVLVIGLQNGHCKKGDLAARDACNAKTIAFLDAFRAKNGAVDCREILGVDLTNLEGQAEFARRNLKQTVCCDMIRSAVAILEAQNY